MLLNLLLRLSPEDEMAALRQEITKLQQSQEENLEQVKSESRKNTVGYVFVVLWFIATSALIMVRAMGGGRWRD